jgi:transcription antitermination factor NusG
MHGYLIYTQAFHEKKVKERIERERFETFLPLIERRSQGKERQQERIHIPLFPGYLFVRAEMNADIYLKILKMKGVLAFFCNDGKPALIPDAEVESLKNGKEVELGLIRKKR